VGAHRDLPVLLVELKLVGPIATGVPTSESLSGLDNHPPPHLLTRLHDDQALRGPRRTDGEVLRATADKALTLRCPESLISYIDLQVNGQAACIAPSRT
jgi:hypothetical protein